MPFEFDSIYLVYVLVAVSAALFFEGIYLLCFTGASYRTHVNRRLKLLRNVTSRESLLIQLRRERGLTRSGGFAIGIESLNRLVVQSGVTIGPKKLIITIVVSALLAFGATLSYRRDLVDALIAGVACGTLLPYLVLLYLRGRRRNKPMRPPASGSRPQWQRSRRRCRTQPPSRCPRCRHPSPYPTPRRPSS